MSRHPEECRGCLRCGHIWYAEKWTVAKRPFFVPAISYVELAVNSSQTYQRRLELVRRWSQCPRCGTKKVITIDPVKLAAVRAEHAARTAQQPNLHPARRLIDWSPPRPENRRG